MKVSQLVMSLLLFSAVAVGLSSFYVDVASNYSITESQLSDFGTTFNKYSTINEKLENMRSKLLNFQVLNPLTWGNVVTLVIDIFSIIFDLPTIIHNLITDMVTISGFLPSWTVWLVEGVIFIIVIFAALKAINKYEV